MPVSSREAVIPVLAEVFREHGYEGASMTLFTEASGLGKGSLYHFFPGGKEEIASAALADVDRWFRERLFAPLRTASTAPDARAAIQTMFDEVEDYFRLGRRVCLPGAFALSRPRDRFADAVSGYFAEWIDALHSALRTAGVEAAREDAVRIVADIQGAIVLTQALGDPDIFRTVLSASRALPWGEQTEPLRARADQTAHSAEEGDTP